MKRMHLLATLVLLVSMFCSTASADDLHRRAAEGFLAFLDSPRRILSINILQENSLNPELAAIESGALVRLEEGGYILISSSRNLTPIKAYSLTRAFEDLPPAVQKYFRQEMERNVRVAGELHSAVGRLPLGAIENEARWDFLLDFDSKRHPLAYLPDTWLLSTTWNQNYPYNKFTPRIEGTSTYAGCVNTAMAQIMKYHRHPAEGRGIVSYQWRGLTLKAVLFKAYNWDHMPDSLDAATPAWQADQVASLMRDIGIANNTDYGIDGSAASIRIENLISHFGYSKDLRPLTNSDPDAFFQSLRTEIDAERPVLLSIPGHMVVADGYGSDPTGRKIHLNMGWGGYDDDFYFLDRTIETENYSFTTEPGHLTLYFPVKPCEGPDCNWASDAVPGAPPVIHTELPDLVLRGEQQAAERVYLDVRTESGEAVSVMVSSSNKTAVQGVIEDSVLILSTGAAGKAGEITVEAEAAGLKTRKSFVVITTGQEAGFGKEFRLAGRFRDSREIYDHLVVLDGPCTVTGDRGYSNQAFYVAVLDSGGAMVVDWADETVQSGFPQGLYTLAASLFNPTTNFFYQYKEGDHDGYVLSVSCPEADESIDSIARFLGIDLRDALASDGRLSLVHAVLLLRYSAGLVHLTDLQKATLNVTGNADLDHVGLADAVLILRTMAGLE